MHIASHLVLYATFEMKHIQVLSLHFVHYHASPQIYVGRSCLPTYWYKGNIPAKGITNPQRKTRIDARAWTTSTAEPKTATGTNKGYCRFIFASCGVWDCTTANTVRVTATEMVPIRKSFGCKNLAKKIGSITNGIKTIKYYPFYADVKRTLFNSSSDGVILLYKVAHTFWLVDSCDICLRHHLQTTTSRNWGRNIKLRNGIGQSLCCLDSRFVEYLPSKTLDWRNKSSFASFKIRWIF